MSVDTFQLQPAELENDLIKLISLQQEDAERLYTVAADPMIWAGHPQKDRYKKEEFFKYFNSAIVENKSFVI